MAYTNVHIPNLYSQERQLAERIRELELKNTMLLETVRMLEQILYNIPEAVNQFGYVDIKLDKETMTLVRKK